MKGFLTIATGDERYFRLAQNLLRSYRYFAKEKYRFAIITDRENEYTEEFDDVVVLDKAAGSYLDKIRLLLDVPYDENIFIDADCLAYSDLNVYWEYFDGADDFSCFGASLDVNSESGWFKKQDVAEYQNVIDFIPHLHGVMYFIRKTDLTRKIHQTCLDIIEHYDRYTFKIFNDN